VVETIKRQTRVVCDCLVAGHSPWAWAWTAAYRLYARSCDTKARRSCSMWLVALCVLPLLCLITEQNLLHVMAPVYGCWAVAIVGPIAWNSFPDLVHNPIVMEAAFGCLLNMFFV